MLRRQFLGATLMAPAAGLNLSAGDWPWFLGPTRDGSAGMEIAKWKGDGPPTVWTLPVGEGFSGPVVASGKVILFHRDGSNHLLEAVRTDTGARLWQTRIPTRYEDPLGRGDGPRSTPAISDGRVFLTTPEASLIAFDLASGKQVWSVDLVDKYGMPQGFFGYGVSPLVHKGLILLNVGGEGAGLVAFSTADGSEKWKVTSQQASYASGVLMRLGDREVAAFLTREGLLAVDPGDGAILSQLRWRSRQNASVNAASPVAIPGGVFLTASYGTGAIALRLSRGGLEKIWNNDDSLSAHYSTPVSHQGYLYGFHGRQEEGGELRCVEINTGKVSWAKPGTGCGWILRTVNKLLVMQENGELLLIRAEPSGCSVEAQSRVLKGPIRALPAFSQGVLFCRDTKECRAVRLAG